MTDSTKEIKKLLKFIHHMDENDLQKVESILQLIYCSQRGELKGARSTIDFHFKNCKVGVFYGR